MVPDPVVDGRRVESLVQELHRYAPHYTPDLNLSDEQSVGPALMRIASHLAEAVLVRLGKTPHKHFVAFLDRLGISLLPARPARAAVTFRLASGVEVPVRVPSGTRVTAPGDDGDIPFETTDEMQAIPGALTAAFGVDPSRDMIFRRPPGFLAQEVRTRTELVYEVQAFATAGAKRLQLNHVTELTPKAYIAIDGTEKHVVEKIDDGSIITLEAPLARDVPAATRVTPIRDFEVFDGIDLQEHVLYLGHADLFTVKEQAEVTLDVELAGSTGLEPLDIAWQFWTKLEDVTPEDEEHWQDLTVKSDATSGLSSSGRVVLIKPEKLEIKSRAVGGVESRWVRAYLRDKLPGATRVLPDVETIGLSVTSGPKDGIPADQAFHNATPLDVKVGPDVGFLPFGTEPRQFDQFYLASEEAFSKPRAHVTLNFELDLQTLATPSVVSSAGQVRAYSIGLRRSLFELNLDSGDWHLLGTPAEVPISERPQGSRFVPVEDSIPAAVADGNHILVFVNTEDSLTAASPPNRIWVHVRAAVPPNPVWVDLGAPGPMPPTVQFSPAAVLTPWAAPQFARVFVVGGDGKLYSRGVSSTDQPDVNWVAHGSPASAPVLNSPLFVTAANNQVFVFVNGGGLVHRWVLRQDGTSEWVSLKQANANFKAVSRPFARPYGSGTDPDAKVFVFSLEQGTDQWKLFECDAGPSVNGEFDWIDLGRPSTNEGIDPRPDAHAPAGFIERPADSPDTEGKHIFLRGADDHLYELLDPEQPGEPPRWEDRSRAGDPPLRDSPAVAFTTAGTTTTIRVLTASKSNSLIAWQFELIDDSVPAAADSVAVRLGQDASDADNQYLGLPFEIVAGTGSGQGLNNVTAYDGTLKLVRLTSQLATLPDDSSQCEIDGDPVGNAIDDADRLFALHAVASGGDTRRAEILELRFDGDVVTADFYSRLTGVVSVPPAAGLGATDYVLYAELVDVTREYLPLEDRSTAPSLSWEYWNGRGWLSLAVADATLNLLSNGKVTFGVPPSIERTEVAGQDNFWIRARLVGGDYGRETFKIVNDVVVSEKSTLRPPKVTRLSIVYTTEPVPPAACLTFNNLDYLDQTAACQQGGAHFRPFDRLEQFPGRSLSLFLGFEKSFKTGPVRVLIDAAEREYDEGRPPEFDWQFRKDRRWKELDAEDGSIALTRQGILTLSASDDLTREARFGEALFWIRGSLRTDRGAGSSDYPRPLLLGLFPNTVWARQGETITDEIVGSSDGEPNQAHTLQHADVLEREDIRVREALSAEERELIERELGSDSVVVREDVGGTWIRWTETAALFDAGPNDRCYLFDRASGVLQFGDGRHGRIPQAGVDNIRAFSYRTGGGAAGNVDAGKIQALVTAIAGIESVFNPTPAGGGSDKADTAAMLTIGPRRISHRDRAVSAEDFEELAFEASRQVAKARCLVTTNLAPSAASRPDPCDPAQRHEARPALGWVSLIIVPNSPDPRPCPSLELRRAVRDHLRRRAPSVLAASDRIVVRPADFVEVGIEAELFVTSLDKASAADTKARTALEELLHPLRGGTDGRGWEFGRPIWKSDVLSALEAIREIDRVENLRFHFRGGTDHERVVIGPNELLASGQHTLAIKKA